MVHSDDEGLVLPPKLASIQVVIVPIYRSDEEQALVLKHGEAIKTQLEEQGVRVKFDKRDTHKPGFKFAEYELKGVPLRISIGPRDIANQQVELARRDTKEKQLIALDKVNETVSTLLTEIQDGLYKKALNYRDSNIKHVNSWDEFTAALDNGGGFISAHWDGSSETELKIKEATKATIRCIPLNNPQENGVCVFSGKPSKERVLFAKAY